MSTPIPFRSGEQEALAEEFIRRRMQLACGPLDHPERLCPEDILAVHYADAGAQGDPGAVWILLRTPDGVGILGGNYAYDDLNLDAVIEKLPMLRCLDTRSAFTPPFPFGGRLHPHIHECDPETLCEESHLPHALFDDVIVEDCRLLEDLRIGKKCHRRTCIIQVAGSDLLQRNNDIAS